ncbi:MAG: hypothetical protein IT340_03485 [Chloroflexi bacterium]|nr:hypothetical protein [Chloroflexota bacterium]
MSIALGNWRPLIVVGGLTAIVIALGVISAAVSGDELPETAICARHRVLQQQVGDLLATPPETIGQLEQGIDDVLAALAGLAAVAEGRHGAPIEDLYTAVVDLQAAVVGHDASAPLAVAKPLIARDIQAVRASSARLAAAVQSTCGTPA